jgi:hypothetical protein
VTKARVTIALLMDRADPRELLGHSAVHTISTQSLASEIGANV